MNKLLLFLLWNCSCFALYGAEILPIENSIINGKFANDLKAHIV